MVHAIFLGNACIVICIDLQTVTPPSVGGPSLSDAEVENFSLEAERRLGFVDG